MIYNIEKKNIQPKINQVKYDDLINSFQKNIKENFIPENKIK